MLTPLTTQFLVHVISGSVSLDDFFVLLLVIFLLHPRSGNFYWMLDIVIFMLLGVGLFNSLE